MVVTSMVMIYHGTLCSKNHQQNEKSKKKEDS